MGLWRKPPAAAAWRTTRTPFAQSCRRRRFCLALQLGPPGRQESFSRQRCPAATDSSPDTSSSPASVIPRPRAPAYSAGGVLKSAGRSLRRDRGISAKAQRTGRAEWLGLVVRPVPRSCRRLSCSARLLAAARGRAGVPAPRPTRSAVAAGRGRRLGGLPRRDVLDAVGIQAAGPLRSLRRVAPQAAPRGQNTEHGADDATISRAAAEIAGHLLAHPRLVRFGQPEHQNPRWCGSPRRRNCRHG